MAELPVNVVDLDVEEPSGISALLTIVEAEVVTIGHVRARCDGWRLAAALCVDLVVAGPDATFGAAGAAADPVARRGRALAGRHVAAYLATTDRLVDAVTAQRWGIVCEIADDPRAAADALARSIEGRSPVAVGTILRQTRLGAARDLRAAGLTARA